MSNAVGVLYVVATPIGNLADMSPRALEVLAKVNLIAAEDTRHSGKLLQHYGITTPLIAFHDHNERAQTPGLIERLKRGDSIALISDAGTPLISDPGFLLVRAAHDHGLRVSPLPGPSAGLAALSASGLPSDSFIFVGFLPSGGTARRRALEKLADEPRSLILYESPHRIVESLRDMSELLGGERPALFARELTKQFETLRRDTLAAVLSWVTEDTNQQRGEIVLVVHGAAPSESNFDPQTEKLLRVLCGQLPLKQAVGLAAEITGHKKNALYDRALALKL